MKKLLTILAALILLSALTACGKDKPEMPTSTSTSTSTSASQSYYPDTLNVKSNDWDGTIASAYESGNGTPESPYEIASCAQLAYLAQEANAGRVYHGQYFYLSADLNLNDWVELGTVRSQLAATGSVPSNSLHQWTPIGTKKEPFDAEFYGRGHKITGLYAEECAGTPYYSSDGQAYETHYFGLFGYVSNAHIQNLIVQEGLLYCHADTVGGIAAYVEPEGADAKIESCSVSGLFCPQIDKQGTRCGGIVGLVDAEHGNVYINHCVNYAQLDGSSSGGIVVDAYTEEGFRAIITECVNYGEVRGGSDTGGIVGYADGGCCIINCLNAGNVSGIGEHSYVGAIVGYDRCDSEEGGYIDNCYFVPEYCDKDYGRSDKDSRILIFATAKENASSEEWLSSLLHFPADWKVEDGVLRLNYIN